MSTINGCVSMPTVNAPTIVAGAVLDRVVTKSTPILTVNGIDIDVLLGMDWIRSIGGLTIRFNHLGNPMFSPPNSLEIEEYVCGNVMIDQPIAVDSIERSDFIVRKFKLPDASCFWEVEWKGSTERFQTEKPCLPHIT